MSIVKLLIEWSYRAKLAIGYVRWNTEVYIYIYMQMTVSRIPIQTYVGVQ